MIKIPSVVILGFIDLSRFIPGVVALALNSSAYVAEIIRAGISPWTADRTRRRARSVSARGRA